MKLLIRSSSSILTRRWTDGIIRDKILKIWRRGALTYRIISQWNDIELRGSPIGIRIKVECRDIGAKGVWHGVMGSGDWASWKQRMHTCRNIWEQGLIKIGMIRNIRTCLLLLLWWLALVLIGLKGIKEQVGRREERI